jgi:L-asparaginase
MPPRSKPFLETLAVNTTMFQTVHVMTTGGTIDSYYDGSKDSVVPHENSVVPEYIRSLKLDENPRFTKICSKDSRDLTPKDLLKLIKEIQRSPCKKFLVTHGTFTMSESARFIKKKLKRKGVTVVFTGSFIPMSRMTFSDGPFNLGYSYAMLQILKPGVYVCMNARTFESDEALKDLRRGRFTSIFGEK